MERVMVIGCSGSGKTTLCGRLHACTGLPVAHLDSMFWLTGWQMRPRKEFDAMLREALEQPRWIMDGDYSRTLEMRFAACDTVIWLDYPRRTCLWGVVRRRIRYAGRTRPDMGRGCPEKLDLAFLRYVWTFDRKRRAQTAVLLASDPTKRAVILHSRREAETFLKGFDK